MGQIVAWNDISFSVGLTSIYGAEDIKISGSCNTKEAETNDEKYVKSDGSKPYEIEMKAVLDARLGADVQNMALKMTEAARCAKTGYFYTGSEKLFPCSFMMISADISEISMNPKGIWLYCEVKLKLKQCTKYDGTTRWVSDKKNSGSSTGKKRSTKRTSVIDDAGSDAEVDAVSGAAGNASSAVYSAMTVVSAAQQASSSSSSSVINSLVSHISTKIRAYTET